MGQLEIQGLSAGYGAVEVLHDLTLTVQSRSVMGVLGRNGAGKTTLLRTISGLTRVVTGEISIDSTAITGHAPALIAQQGVAHVPEGRRVFRSMTVLDNLLVGAYAHKGHRSDDALAYVYDVFPRLKERRKQRAETLSGGEQQMLAIGRALMMQPRLLMLDEPSQGLAPALVRQVLESVAVIAQGGVTVLLVEQNARALFDVIDRGLILIDGRVSQIGDREELRGSALLESILTDFDS